MTSFDFTPFFVRAAALRQLKLLSQETEKLVKKMSQFPQLKIYFSDITLNFFRKGFFLIVGTFTIHVTTQAHLLDTLFSLSPVLCTKKLSIYKVANINTSLTAETVT